MGKIKDKVINFIKYLTRDELDEKRKIINLTITSTLVLMVVSFLMDLAVGVLSGIFFFLLTFILSIGVLWDINCHEYSMRPFYLTYIYKSFILYPLMYCSYGGINSGMYAWFILNCLVTWILFDGQIKYLLCVLDFAVLVVMSNVEGMFDIVKHFETEDIERIDMIISAMLVSCIFFVIFEYFNRTHRKKNEMLEVQNKMLKEQEDVLAKTNQEIAKANLKLEKVNADLENALAAKSNFLASMSHEIRTPINAVLGMDEMILRECEDETILKYATDIDSAGHQLLAIINDILDYSRIESGKMEIHPVEYELYSIANDCFNMINMRAKKKNLAFSIENDPNLPSYLVGDEIRIRQIIMNMLTNAVKYTREGYVKLSFSKETVDDKNIMLVVSVKDTGIGISKDSIGRLFGAFERIEETKNRHIEGTGLGLSITKRFVDLMNGTIEVESEVDIGSTFTVKIPQQVALKDPMGDFAERFSKRTNIATVRNGIFTAPTARIMVVDDVKMNLNVVRLLLKNTKMEIDLASSGSESVAMSMMKRYDVILMDHMMPEMDGIEALHKIREIKHGLNDKTPVIALTANALEGAEDMYIKEGFQGYLAKPIKGAELEAALVKYIPNEKVEYIVEDD